MTGKTEISYKPFQTLRLSYALIAICLVAIASTAQTSAPATKTAVTMFHNDTKRTGWNSHETTLTPANVSSSQFGLLGSIVLDDEVDVQPLLVPGVNISAGSHQGVHDVLYLVTASNTVYAIDANTFTVLLTTNLGAAVPYPLGCRNSAPTVGVNSTPVIDTTTGTMYLIAYTLGDSAPVYTLHALNIRNLTDRLTPQVVTASHMLSDGTTFQFDATYQRQRPALLEANGNVYAAFGSFCDFYPTLSRGWLLGWNAATLNPLANNEVLNTQATNATNYFLGSIWMSGSGPAADDSGNILFVTGNSDPTSYDGVSSIQESVVKVSPDLSKVVDLFTPANWSTLDENDTDFGSGGIMVLPDQPGSKPHLAVAAGKDGNMYFMNEDSLGGYSPTGNNVLGTYTIGKCWCSASYAVYGNAALVVGSGSNAIKVFKVVTSPSPALQVVASATITTGQPIYNVPTGFYTSVSSNGGSNPIIWAVSRPVTDNPANISVYAFGQKPGTQAFTQLFTSVAGTWPYYRGRYNLPPTVANGKVYVASYQLLNIYGLLPTAKSK